MKSIVTRLNNVTAQWGFYCNNYRRDYS